MYHEIYYFNLVPAAIVVLLLAIYSVEKLMLLTVFLTPLAINLQDLDGGLGLSLPTEPIIFGIMIIFLLKQLHRAEFDKKVLQHPITIAIFINLIWIAFTTITSEHPIVSIKFLISRLWFVISFYFMGTQLFQKYSNIKTFNWLYITSFIIIIIYTLYTHAGYGFDEKTANYVMSPFYNDHTVYGAMLAMFLPTIIFYTFNKKHSPSVKFVAISFLIIFIIALIFSYTRAAWLSLIIALLAYIVLLLKIKFRTILLIAGCITTVLLYYRTDIVMKLEKNRQDASKDFEKHIQSIANISTDASNLERLNRWSAAFRLFEERPIVGWGPGTYSFVYAPYQHANEKTIISTNMGDRGNAHSEYIGPLCESGVLGALTFIVIVLITIGTGFKLFYSIQEHELKMTVLVTLLGFITYVVHGVLNNFLDTDKASVPFWGFVAMLVAIDVYHKNKVAEENKI
ncbi:MAG: O-antigen ligase family protein [Bacteroidia bacterium]|nr:O-antigen ligase family protein [Bacteroidia bacterium]